HSQSLDPLEICRALSWIIPYVLFSLGSYYVVDDLTQEAKTGTLNFIRLSPRPAREILLGKLLGVPLLPLILVLTAVPMHVISGLSAGVSWLLLLSYYAIVGAGAVFVFMLALLVGLSGGKSALRQQRAVGAIAFSGLVLLAITPIFMSWNTEITWQSIPTGELLFRSWRTPVLVNWLYLPISRNPWLAHLFLLGNLAVACALVWQMLVRQFSLPQTTLLSKQSSYLTTAYLNALACGFLLSPWLDADDQFDSMIAIYIANVALFGVLLFALVSSRQQLMDWINYRARSSGIGRLRDWIWAEASPMVGAIAINFLIAAVLLVPFTWLIRSQLDRDPISAIALVFATLSIGVSLLTYATLVQLIFSTKVRSPLIWAAGTVAVVAFVPPLVLGFSGYDPQEWPRLGFVWTYLGVPLMGDVATSVPPLAWVGFIGQLCLLALLWNRLSSQLRKLRLSRTAVNLPSA
ncbi:hypothetical protein, partial [cf. Phormidesmis sp. LEGE 11477]|uniref:hypothetical protein n=1 Tax=cf. Phormidesmis sp. LEGE 11477 TaxID=1828680 RepID=UPI00187FAE59